jgi:branched-chain amino acid transport system permease protein
MEGLVTAAVLALAAVGPERWSSASCAWSTSRMANSSCWARCWPGLSPAWFPARRRWPSCCAGHLRRCCRRLAAAADGLILKRLNYDPEATIVATIGLLYMIQQAALSLYGPDAARSRRPSTGASNCRGSAIPATSCSSSSRPWRCCWRCLALHDPHQGGPDHARHPGRPHDGPRLRHQRRPGLCRHLRAWRGLAALAAVLVVPIQQAHYLMGGDPLLLSFIVVIIGGLGSAARHADRGAGHRACRTG